MQTMVRSLPSPLSPPVSPPLSYANTFIVLGFIAQQVFADYTPGKYQASLTFPTNSSFTTGKYLVMFGMYPEQTHCKNSQQKLTAKTKKTNRRLKHHKRSHIICNSSCYCRFMLRCLRARPRPLPLRLRGVLV